jgi:hypothetical protein
MRASYGVNVPIKSGISANANTIGAFGIDIKVEISKLPDAFISEYNTLSGTMMANAILGQSIRNPFLLVTTLIVSLPFY